MLRCEAALLAHAWLNTAPLKDTLFKRERATSEEVALKKTRFGASSVLPAISRVNHSG